MFVLGADSGNEVIDSEHLNDREKRDQPKPRGFDLFEGRVSVKDTPHP